VKSDWRKFGVGLSIILVVIGTVQLLTGSSLYRWTYLVAGMILLAALFLPVILKPLYILFSYIGFVLGWIMTRVILSVLFFLIITPIGLISRLVGKRYLQTGFRTGDETYWETVRDSNPSRQHYEKQY